MSSRAHQSKAPQPATADDATPMRSATILVEDIEIGERLRSADTHSVAMMAESIEAQGLLQPIIVRKLDGGRYALIDGMHRLGAHKLLGRPSIAAQIAEMSSMEARLAEIDSNLMRIGLNPLDRAVFLAKRKRVWEEMHPETVNILKRQKKGQTNQSFANLSQVSMWSARFSKEAAKNTGLSERSIQRAAELYSKLGSELIAALHEAPIVFKEVELRKILKLEPEEIVRLLGAIQAGSRSVRDAMEQCGVGETTVVRLDAQIKKLRAFENLWASMSMDIRRRALGYACIDQEMIDQIVENWRRNPKWTRKTTNQPAGETADA